LRDASASDAVADAAEAGKGAIGGYQKSVSGKFLHLNDPADITKAFSEPRTLFAKCRCWRDRIHPLRDSAGAPPNLTEKTTEHNKY
jgi:hypothetical protein